jgi:hypothetical protein
MAHKGAVTYENSASGKPSEKTTMQIPDELSPADRARYDVILKIAVEAFDGKVYAAQCPICHGWLFHVAIVDNDSSSWVSPWRNSWHYQCSLCRKLFIYWESGSTKAKPRYKGRLGG